MTDWKDYEREIEDQFRILYPTATITPNAKLQGKFSKIERQIDLLIEETASDHLFRVVVDAKHRGRPIDVGDIEAFIGQVRDVEAHTGMLIALEGYTKAAINRAHYDDSDIILDVLNLDEVKQFQGPTAIAYAGPNGVSVAAPFGWIVDATRREGFLATLYQRGVTFEEAVRAPEFMYLQFWRKDKKRVNTVDALLTFQEGYMLGGSPDAKIEIIERGINQRLGVKTLIRRFERRDHPGIEYTGFADFDNFIFMCVLFTPTELADKNLRKLRFVLRDSFPMVIQRDNTALIASAEEKLKDNISDAERAVLLAEIGWWYRDMEKLEQGRHALEESLALEPRSYPTVKQLLATLTKLDDKTAALDLMARLLRMEPRNPTVFKDCILYANDTSIGPRDLADLFDSLKQEYAGDVLIEANCDFYASNVLFPTDHSEAEVRLAKAETGFRAVLPADHQVFEQLKHFRRT